MRSTPTRHGRAPRPAGKQNAAAMLKLAIAVRQLVLATAPTLREDVQPGYVRFREHGVVICAVMTHDDHVNVQFYFAPIVSPDSTDPTPGKRLETLTFRTPEDIHPNELIPLLRQAMKRDRPATQES